MEKKNTIFTKKNIKIILFFINIIGLILFVSGLTIMYVNYNFQKGINWVNSEKYEDSDIFLTQVESDIDNIFEYERYKNIFETNGKYDENIKIFSLSDGPERDYEFTIKEVLKIARENGYYIDNHYDVVRNEEVNLEDDDFWNKKYNVNWKKYSNNDSVDGPGSTYITLQELVEETLDNLCKYYKSYDAIIKKTRNIYYYINYDGNISTNNKKIKDDIYNYGKYIYIDSDDINPNTNMIKLPSNIYYQINNTYEFLHHEENTQVDKDYHYIVMIGIDTNYTKNDEYYRGSINYSHQRDLYFYGALLIFSGIIFIATSVVIYLILLYRGNNKAINYYWMDNISFEIRILLYLVVCVILWLLMKNIGAKIVHLFIDRKYWLYCEKLIVYILIYFSSLITFASLFRSHKLKLLWDKSLLKKLKDESFIYRTTYSFTKIVFLSYAIYIIVNLIFIIFIIEKLLNNHTIIDRFALVLAILLGIIFNILVFHNIYMHSYMLDRIVKALDDLNNGKDYTIDIDEFKGKARGIAKKINNIGKGLEVALEEQVKSERLKADLITNVSHDIKTPLTSIINYINLIKLENIDNDNIKEYLKILEKKSMHLKDLTEDLLEASKVSSGNIKIELSKLNFTELVLQTNGEFEEKYREKDLEIVFKENQKDMIIMADGAHLWRVLENIYNNAYNYSSKSTRVYIELIEHNERAVFIMKNISSSPLNINPDELTERFVRGDLSRSTKGSGLGLSIAKSLTVAQGGSFDINIDGDLFKIIIGFDLIL